MKEAKAYKKITVTLLDMLIDKDWSEITVTELCRKANVNRSTFYDCDSNMHALAFSIEEEYHRNFKKLLVLSHKEIMDAVENNDITTIKEKIIIPYLQFVEQNKKYF